MANRQKRQSKFLSQRRYCLWVMVGILLITSVFFTIDTATGGAEVSKLQKTETTLAQENRVLTDTLVQSSSLKAIDSKAKELGFSQPDKVVYISQKEAVAEAR